MTFYFIGKTNLFFRVINVLLMVERDLATQIYNQYFVFRLKINILLLCRSRVAQVLIPKALWLYLPDHIRKENMPRSECLNIFMN